VTRVSSLGSIPVGIDCRLHVAPQGAILVLSYACSPVVPAVRMMVMIMV